MCASSHVSPHCGQGRDIGAEDARVSHAGRSSPRNSCLSGRPSDRRPTVLSSQMSSLRVIYEGHAPARLRLGQLLVDARILRPSSWSRCSPSRRPTGGGSARCSSRAGSSPRPQLTQILSQQLSVPWVSLYHIDFSRELLNLVPRDVAEKYCLVPIYVRPVAGRGTRSTSRWTIRMNEDALRECTEFAGLPVARHDRRRRATSGKRSASTTARVPPSPPAPPSGRPAPPPWCRAPGQSVAPRRPAARPLAPRPRPRRCPALAAPARRSSGSPHAGRRLAATPDSGLTPTVRRSRLSWSMGLRRSTGSFGTIPSAKRREAARAEEAPRSKCARWTCPSARRKQVQLTLLDGTTIKLPSGQKKRSARAIRHRPKTISPRPHLAALRPLPPTAPMQPRSSATTCAGRRCSPRLAALRKRLIMEKELMD